MKVPVGITNAINEIFRLRKEIDMFKKQETDLVITVKEYMSNNRVLIIDTDRVSAQYSERTTLIPDPDKLYDALENDWMRFISCVSVRLDSNTSKRVWGVREFLGEEDIKNISKIETTPILSVKLLKATAPEKQPKVRPANAAPVRRAKA